MEDTHSKSCFGVFAMDPHESLCHGALGRQAIPGHHQGLEGPEQSAHRGLPRGAPMGVKQGHKPPMPGNG